MIDSRHNARVASLATENKTTQPGDARAWAWEMVRAAAALYNSGGGTLRIGVEEDGLVTGGQKLSDYLPEHSPFAQLLRHYLDPAPAFEAKEVEGYIAVIFAKGVTSPTILKKALEGPTKNSGYERGTVFVRKMAGSKPASEPPKDHTDWRRALHLWETNRESMAEERW